MSDQDLLSEGRTAFNQGEFFRAHELWEEVWHLLTGRDRDLLQGLIQIAAGCHHALQGRRRPAASLLLKGAAKMANASAPTLAEHGARPAVADAHVAPPVLFDASASHLALFIERVAQSAVTLADDGAHATKFDPSTLKL